MSTGGFAKIIQDKDVTVTLTDNAGASKCYIKDSDGTIVMTIDSLGNVVMRGTLSELAEPG